jgi:hypothetical protein
MFGLQQNKQTAELEREPNCFIVSQLVEFKLVYSSPMIAGQGLSYTHTITVDASADARL